MHNTEILIVIQAILTISQVVWVLLGIMLLIISLTSKLVLKAKIRRLLKGNDENSDMQKEIIRLEERNKKLTKRNIIFIVIMVVLFAASGIVDTVKRPYKVYIPPENNITR